MNVRESNRSRHLVIRLGRGDELPAAIARALDEAEARSAWIAGVGSLEAAEIATYDQASKRYREARRIHGASEAVSIQGNAATLDGVTTVRLSVSLARETETGLESIGGQLVWARAFDVELIVTVLDDVTLTRAADEATGLPALVARPSAANAIPAAAERPAAAIPLPASPLTTADAPRPAAQPSAHEGPAIPHRPMKPQDDLEVIYPEAGDRVTHFHFGECTVITSDGDRIRLQQDKDSRVREVALTMLKIEEPTTQPDGKRHFKLGRKN